jgi:hypothetical protein
VLLDSNYLGLGVALLVVGLLALVLRWAYPRSPVSPALFERPGPDADFGLLTEVVRVSGAVEGRQLRALLSDAGIRSTMTTDRSGQVRILVFAPDAERAKRLVGRP